jgi:hypothetical protein
MGRFGVGNTDDIESTLRAGRSRYPGKGKIIFFFFKTSRRAPGPSRPPTQSIPGFNPEDKAVGL